MNSILQSLKCCRYLGLVKHSRYLGNTTTDCLSCCLKGRKLLPATTLEKKVVLNSASIWASNESDIFTEYKCYVCKWVHVSVSCMEYGLKTKMQLCNVIICSMLASLHNDPRMRSQICTAQGKKMIKVF